MKDKTCAGRPGYAFSCDRKPSVERDGKCYCWQHDIERLAKISDQKRRERMAHHAKVQAEQEARIERRLLEKESGVDSLTVADLQAIAALGGIRAMIAKLSKA